MLTLPPSVRIFVATEPADMRKSIDGLAALVQGTFEEHPCSGHLFLFRNRQSDRIKVLVWDGSGFWVLYKRLEKGRLHFPVGKDGVARIPASELNILLSGLDLRGARRRAVFVPRSAAASK